MYSLQLTIGSKLYSDGKPSGADKVSKSDMQLGLSVVSAANDALKKLCLLVRLLWKDLAAAWLAFPQTCVCPPVEPCCV